VPAIISFSIVPRRNGVKKDTLKNLEHTRDFVINVVIEELGEAMNQTSADYPSYVDEFKEVGLTPVKSDIVKAPRLGESPVSMECNLLQTLEFGQSPNGATLVIGEIVLVHLRKDYGLIARSRILAWADRSPVRRFVLQDTGRI